MLTIERNIIDDTNAHTNPVVVDALSTPVQYALYGESIVSACREFRANAETISYASLGKSATETLSCIAESFLRNNIAVPDITAFSLLSLTERGKQHQFLSDALQIAFNDHIETHAPAVLDLCDFTLGLTEADRHNSIRVTLTPDFTFSVAILHDRLTEHPLYVGIRQFCFVLAQAVGVCDDVDMKDRIGSEIEDYVSLHDSKAILANFDAISDDIDNHIDENDDYLSIDDINKKWIGVITFEDDWISPDLMQSIDFVLTEKSIERMGIAQLHAWVVQNIDALQLTQDAIAIQLLADIEYIRDTDLSHSSMINDSDDSLFNSLIFISQPYEKLSPNLVEQLDTIGNDAWNNGLDTYLTIDLNNPCWQSDLHSFSKTFEIVERYMSLEY